MSEGGFEPPPLSGPEPKSDASASSATRPYISSRVVLSAMFFPRCSYCDGLRSTCRAVRCGAGSSTGQEKLAQKLLPLALSGNSTGFFVASIGPRLGLEWRAVGRV